MRQDCWPRHRRCAFSLVELAIVLVIVGIVSAVAVPKFTLARTRAQTAQVKSTVRIMQGGLDMFIAEHPSYTPPAGMGANNHARLAAVLNPGANNILLNDSNAAGDPASSGFGPYLRSIPSNTLIHDSLATNFIGAADAGSAAQGGGTSIGWFCTWSAANPLIGFFSEMGATKGITRINDGLGKVTDTGGGQLQLQ